MKSAAGGHLPRIDVAGTWKHAATTGYQGWILRITASDLLAPASFSRTRFNPGDLVFPGMELLYLALDEQTALFEKRVQFGNPFGDPSLVLVNAARMASIVVVDVEVDLRHVVDLTDPTAHDLLGSSAQELTSDWDGYERRQAAGSVLNQPTGLAPTQMLGWELFQEPNIEGIKTISAKVPTTCSLAIFTHKLTRPGSLAWDDPNTGQREHYP